MDRREDKGVYRRIQVRIMGAFHDPAEPVLIPQFMQELLTEYRRQKRTTHVIERAAMFHLKFEGIHPFIDGNGRTGRLLMNLELMQNGYPAINVKFTDRKRYYDSFDAYYRDGDSAPMVKMVAAYVEEQIQSYLKIHK